MLGHSWPQTCAKGLSSLAQVTHSRPAWGQPSAHTMLQGLHGLPGWDHLWEELRQGLGATLALGTLWRWCGSPCLLVTPRSAAPGGASPALAVSHPRLPRWCISSGVNHSQHVPQTIPSQHSSHSNGMPLWGPARAGVWAPPPHGATSPERGSISGQASCTMWEGVRSHHSKWVLLEDVPTGGRTEAIAPLGSPSHRGGGTGTATGSRWPPPGEPLSRGTAPSAWRCCRTWTLGGKPRSRGQGDQGCPGCAEVSGGLVDPDRHRCQAELPMDVEQLCSRCARHIRHGAAPGTARDFGGAASQ